MWSIVLPLVVTNITQCGRWYYPWWLLTLPIVVSDVTLGGQPHYPFVLEPLISLAFRHLPNKIIQQDNLSLYLLKINNILTNNTPVKVSGNFTYLFYERNLKFIFRFFNLTTSN